MMSCRTCEVDHDPHDVSSMMQDQAGKPDRARNTKRESRERISYGEL